jgi:hypothetical protein
MCVDRAALLGAHSSSDAAAIVANDMIASRNSTLLSTFIVPNDRMDFRENLPEYCL